MRNRALHDSLREFALEAAALLTEDLKAGAELQFDVEDEGGRRGPSLYRYRALTDRFIALRWPRLRELQSCRPAADALGAGASAWLAAGGLRGAQAEPALQAMLERLYDDATSFIFPEERFERVYRELEQTLYRDTVGATLIAGLPGMEIESEQVDLGNGLSLRRASALEPALEDEVAGVLERDVVLDDRLSADEARERFRRLLTGLRMFKPGGVGLAAFGWQQAGEGRWSPVEIGGTGRPRGEPWVLEPDEEQDVREFLGAVERAPQGGRVAWALGRFDMGASRRLDAEALSDYLLALRALLDVTPGAGNDDLPLRLAALCAEDGTRRAVQRRVELALKLERFVIGGGRGEELGDWIGGESPRALVEELEWHARALLRDVICGYLDPDLKAIADEILLDTSGPAPAGEPAVAPAVPPEPPEIEARDLRREPATTELEAVEPEPAQSGLGAAQGWPNGSEEERAQPRFARVEVEGVTPSADWDEFSAPV